MNNYLKSLTEYPFFFLRELLAPVEKNDEETLGLHIGEPKNPPPAEALDILNKHASLYSKYPTSKGEYFLRESYCNWLKRRYFFFHPSDYRHFKEESNCNYSKSFL